MKDHGLNVKDDGYIYQEYSAKGHQNLLHFIWRNVWFLRWTYRRYRDIVPYYDRIKAFKDRLKMTRGLPQFEMCALYYYNKETYIVGFDRFRFGDRGLVPYTQKIPLYPEEGWAGTLDSDKSPGSVTYVARDRHSNEILFLFKTAPARTLEEMGLLCELLHHLYDYVGFKDFSKRMVQLKLRLEADKYNQYP